MHFKYEWTLWFWVYVIDWYQKMHLVWILAGDFLQKNIAMLTTVRWNCKSIASPVHAVKTYRGRRCIAPLVLKLGTRCRWAVNFMSRPLYHLESAPIPTEQESGWAPVPVWTFWLREKFLTAARIGIPDGPTRDLVTTLTKLSRLPTCCNIASDFSYYTPHSASYSGTQLNNQPPNI